MEKTGKEEEIYFSKKTIIYTAYIIYTLNSV